MFTAKLKEADEFHASGETRVDAIIDLLTELGLEQGSLLATDVETGSVAEEDWAVGNIQEHKVVVRRGVLVVDWKTVGPLVQENEHVD